MIGQNDGLYPPFFYEYFSNLDRDLEDDLREIRGYFTSTDKCPDESFEQRIKNLIDAIDGKIFEKNSINEVLLLFKSLLKLYNLDDLASLNDLNKIDRNVLSSVNSIFVDIYDFLKYIFTFNPKVDKAPKVRIIISRKFDQSSFGITGDSLKNMSTSTRYDQFVEIFDSQNIDLISAFKDVEHIFFVGHGLDSEEGGFKYCDKFDCGFYLTNKIICDSINNKPKIIGLFSCGIEPYKDNLDIAEYLILPTEKSKNIIHAESFIKGFLLKWNEIRDIEICIKLGLLAILIRNIEELQYNIYHNKQPFI